MRNKERKNANRWIIRSAKKFEKSGLGLPLIPEAVNPLFRLALLGQARVLAGYPTQAPDYAA